MNNATILLESGEKISLEMWQRIYALPVGSKKIGRFFTIGEKSFKNGLEISELIIKLIDKVRELKGSPVKVNSLDRTKEYQISLKNRGYRAATTSPHVVKMAADIDTTTTDDTFEMVELISEAANRLSLVVRIGYNAYLKDGNTFVHVDVCPMYYGAGKAFAKEACPDVWRRKVEW